MKVGEGDDGSDIGSGAADDGSKLMVLEDVGVPPVESVPVVEDVDESEFVGGLAVELCWVGGGVSLDVGVMGRIDPGRETEDGGWDKEAESGGGGPKVGIARRPGTDIAEGTVCRSVGGGCVTVGQTEWKCRGTREAICDRPYRLLQMGSEISLQARGRFREREGRHKGGADGLRATALLLEPSARAVEHRLAVGKHGPEAKRSVHTLHTETDAPVTEGDIVPVVQSKVRPGGWSCGTRCPQTN